MVDTQADELIDRIKQDMRQAMKSGERVRLNALRSLLAQISNAEAIAPQGNKVNDDSPVAGAAEGVGSTEVSRKQLTLAEVHSIVHGEISEIKAVLDGLDETSEYASELREKIAAIQMHA